MSFISQDFSLVPSLLVGGGAWFACWDADGYGDLEVVVTAPFSMPKFYFGAAWILDANQVLLSWILLRVGLIFFFFIF